MTVHFTYEEPPSQDQLMQGDVLKRTEALEGLLEMVHPHFYQHPKNLYFMVLTQSCDLVQRPAGQPCKAPYITIAPVRPVGLVIERQIDVFKSLGVESDLPVLTNKEKTKLSEFLRRLYNNNEPGYFFLEQADTQLPEDCCAFLNLSISIRSTEHYEKCLKAKILELEPSFQAKLGWLVGQMYSRVGTQDWEKEPLNSKVSAALKDAAIWVADTEVEAIVEKYRELRIVDPSARMTAQQIQSARKSAVTKRAKVIERAAEIAEELLRPDAESSRLLRARLKGDAALSALLK